MNQTVAYDQHENTKQIINAINVFGRHCRIGKVRIKPGVVLYFKSWEKRPLTSFPSPPFSSKANDVNLQAPV